MDSALPVSCEERHLAAQPLVRLSENGICPVGSEILLRVGIPPWRALALVSASGHGRVFAASLLERAIEYGRRKRMQKGNEAWRVQVNADTHMLELDLLAAIPESERSHVILELNETSLSHVLEYEIRRRLYLWAEAGIGFALDDFNSSSYPFAAFMDLPVRQIKLDRRLIARMPFESSARSLSRSVALLCADHRIELVVEGVETEWERDCALSTICASIDSAMVFWQGFLYGKPSIILHE